MYWVAHAKVIRGSEAFIRVCVCVFVHNGWKYNRLKSIIHVPRQTLILIQKLKSQDPGVTKCKKNRNGDDRDRRELCTVPSF